MKNHLKSALDSIRRSPFQAIAAVSVLSLTFFVSTMLAILVYSSNKIVNYFETRPQIIAFLKDTAKQEEISSLKNKLSSDLRVKQVKYVTKEEALSIYKKATSDNPLLSELVSPSIFPASLEFSPSNLSSANDLIEETKKAPIVSSVGFTASIGGEKAIGDVLTRLKNLTLYLRASGVAIVGVLAITSFFVLLMIIGLRMSARREEVEILKLIGATPGFIRSPIIFEGVIYALLGILIGWLVSLLLILYAMPTLLSYFGDIPFLPRDTISLLKIFFMILGGEILVGTLLALSGSLLAISRAKTR
ncbi:FtsX-like permease family protein [Candidatus Woesebacteria bacterium]|nr:FtsX-like permease family protein [Candidatus Woesebacteria bacterium]